MTKKKISIVVGAAICMILMSTMIILPPNVHASTGNTYTREAAETFIGKSAPEDRVKTDGSTVFAGWYMDSDYETPVYKNSDLSDCQTLYAKFVDKKILSMGIQLCSELEEADLTKESNEYYIRLLTSVDSLNFSSVGFKINGGKLLTSNSVYDTVEGYKKSETEHYSASDIFAEDSKHFMAYTLTEIQNLSAADATDHLGYTLTVVPQWTTLDGVTVEGEAWTFELNDFLYQAEIDDTDPNNDVVAPEEHVWYKSFWNAYSVLIDGEVTGDAKPIVLTILEDFTLTGRIRPTKNVTFQNKANKDIVITRADDFKTQQMFNVAIDNIKVTWGRMGNDSGSLILDGNNIEVQYSVVEVNEGEFTLAKNGVIRNGNSTSTGAGLKNYTSSHIYGTITGNKATGNGAGIYNAGNDVAVYSGAKISANSTDLYGGGIYNNTNTLTITGGDVSNNKAAKDGGGIYAKGTVKIIGGNVSENTATTNGGGICFAGTSLELAGGSIASNETINGGGIYITSGTVKITGGDVSENTVTTNGGGICFAGGSLELAGGSIASNTAKNGGGIHIVKGLTLNLTKGTIYDNTATQYGGGLNLDGTLNLTSDDVIIQSNTATNHGGGICVQANGSFTMTAGTIRNNKTDTNGGGVYTYVKVSITGGTIQSNIAGQYGGGVYCNKASASGSVLSDGVVSGNTATSGYNNDSYCP